MSIKFRGV
jgi:hypothetical protein